MSDQPTSRVTETVTEETTQPTGTELPADHPLVKTLEVQKDQIRELKAEAKRLDELDEANKTEADRVADRVAKAEAASVDICCAIQPSPIPATGRLERHSRGQGAQQGVHPAQGSPGLD